MKICIYITILLVAIGVCNSTPRMTTSDLDPYMDESEDITIDTKTFVDDLGREVTMTSNGNITSWEREGTKECAGRVKIADEIAKKQAEWGWKRLHPWYSDARLPDTKSHHAFEDRKQYGPKPTEMSLWLQGLNGATHD